jgi:hypothetical protein
MGKNKNVKVVVSVLLLGALFFGGISYAASEAVQLSAYYGVKLVQNGIDKTPQADDLKPFIANGRTYVPLKAVGDLLGVDVTWDGENDAVNIGKPVIGTPLGVPSELVDKTLYQSGRILSNQPMQINGKNYGNKGFQVFAQWSSSSYKDTDKETLSFDLNGQYSNLTLSVGADDKKMDLYESSFQVSFKDQDGNVLKKLNVGKGTVQDGLNIKVKGVTKLYIELTPGNDLGYVDFINPILN